MSDEPVQRSIEIPEFCPQCGLREAPMVPRMFVCGSIHSPRQIGALQYESEACVALAKEKEETKRLTGELERMTFSYRTIMKEVTNA